MWWAPACFQCLNFFLLSGRANPNGCHLFILIARVVATFEHFERCCVFSFGLLRKLSQSWMHWNFFTGRSNFLFLFLIEETCLTVTQEHGGSYFIFWKELRNPGSFISLSYQDSNEYESKPTNAIDSFYKCSVLCFLCFVQAA